IHQRQPAGMFRGPADQDSRGGHGGPQFSNRHGAIHRPVECVLLVYDRSGPSRGCGPAWHVAINPDPGDSPMSTMKHLVEIIISRRRLVCTAMIFAAVGLAAAGFADAQSSKVNLPQIKPGTNTSFGPLKQIDAGLLNVGYVE